MPLNNFIPTINRELEKQFPKDARFYGIAQSLPRISGTVEESLPAVVHPDGTIQYVGIDDKYSVQAYHKLTGIAVANVTGRGGFGDDLGSVVNTYSMALFVYHDLKRSWPTSDLFLQIQNTIPQGLQSHPYQQILVRLTSVILNSGQLFAQEYKGTAFKLPPHAVLFQLNYTIESTHKRGCFDKLCPEDHC